MNGHQEQDVPIFNDGIVDIPGNETFPHNGISEGGRIIAQCTEENHFPMALQSDTAEDEESENYPQEPCSFEEASQCTENGKPVRKCTEETLEPRLVVYGTRSAWSRGSGQHPAKLSDK
ncbi:hypothetical protein ABFA07_022499 [Porites harrisoni]